MGSSVVYRWLRHCVDLLLPGQCMICSEPGLPARELCSACLAMLPRLPPSCPRCALPLPADAVAGQCCEACLASPPPLTATVAAFVYDWPVDGLLRRFKFHQDLAAGRLLSQLMMVGCAAAEQPQLVVPISLHRQRLRRRGYDQALELAKPIAAALQLPCRPLLQRIRLTQPQSRLDAQQRASNLLGAFVALEPPPAHVVLVDDVMTTGATLQAAAQALLAAGALRVDAWVCARVP